MTSPRDSREQYLFDIKEELIQIFDDSIIKAYVDYNPVLLSMNCDPDDDHDVIACDLAGKYDESGRPLAGYDITIIIDSDDSYAVLNQPVVTDKLKAKALLMDILKNVHEIIYV
ncbi:hypothetical protein IFG57_003978 [Salmonella enterica]|nr:hypothetical protein [Salmonella enterica]